MELYHFITPTFLYLNNRRYWPGIYGIDGQLPHYHRPLEKYTFQVNSLQILIDLKQSINRGSIEETRE